jgi:hypothetical protein
MEFAWNPISTYEYEIYRTHRPLHSSLHALHAENMDTILTYYKTNFFHTEYLFIVIKQEIKYRFRPVVIINLHHEVCSSVGCSN